MTKINPSKTMVMRVEAGASAVYRVETAASTYRLALQTLGERKFAVLQGHSQTTGGPIEVRDSDPRIGVRSLFTVEPSSWVGECLQLGTVSTSPVVAVKQESCGTLPGMGGTIVSAGPAAALVSGRSTVRPDSSESSSEKEEPETPYPERQVEYAEYAAQFLRSVERKGALQWDVESQPHLRDRLRVALSECQRLAGVLTERFSDAKKRG